MIENENEFIEMKYENSNGGFDIIREGEICTIRRSIDRSRIVSIIFIDDYFCDFAVLTKIFKASESLEIILIQKRVN